MKHMRCYNNSYMASHNIDCFFLLWDKIPCYAPSNGYILPKEIKVQINRRNQNAIYGDIIKECKYYLKQSKQLLSYNSLEWDFFYCGDKRLQREGSCALANKPEETFCYLTNDDFSVLPCSIDYLLKKEFGLLDPTQEHRNSFFKAYVQMARRGFFCLYPFIDDKKGLLLMLIGAPRNTLSEEKYNRTFAMQKSKRFPLVNSPSVMWIYQATENLIEKGDVLTYKKQFGKQFII